MEMTCLAGCDSETTGVSELNQRVPGRRRIPRFGDSTRLPESLGHPLRGEQERVCVSSESCLALLGSDKGDFQVVKN